MTENTGEHAHHAHKSDSFSAYVLPLSILLAAVIIGYSLVASAAAVAAGLENVTIAGAGNGSTVLPPAENGQGTLEPGPTKTMAELAATDYAGKIGSDSAPLVMIEYSDFQCPFCRRHYVATHQDLVTKYVDTGKLQIIFKDFPLSFHPMAGPYANAARCAGEQGKYVEMHDKIFDEQQIIDPTGATVNSVTNDDIKSWAQELGLNTSTFNSCFDASKYQSNIDATFAEGSSVGVSGTPSFVLGKRSEKGQLIVGAQPAATFNAAIDSLLS